MSPEDFALRVQEPVGGRESHDHYPTPAPCTRALIQRLGAAVYTAELIADPFAGEGGILDVVRELSPETGTIGLEIDPGRVKAAGLRGHGVDQADALEELWHAAPVITNPPYTEALSATRKAAELVAAKLIPWAALLLRLSFLGSQQRADFHRKHPAHLLILSRRPSFDGRGNDSADSAWFVYGWGTPGAWEVLP